MGTKTEWDEFRSIATARGWDTPGGAEGDCSFAATEFVQWLGEGRAVGLTGSRIGWSNHAVSVLPDGRVVDWTRRQFEPDADFPTTLPSVDHLIEWEDTHTLYDATGGIDWESIVGTPEEWASWY